MSYSGAIKDPSNPIHVVGGPGSWNQDRDYTPTVIYDANRFSGHGDSSDFVPYRYRFPQRVLAEGRLNAYPTMVRGLKFVYEPPVLRFFDGRLEPLDDWGKRLTEAFKREMGDY